METCPTPCHTWKTRIEPFHGHSSHRALQGKAGLAMVDTPWLWKNVFQRIVPFPRDQYSRRWRSAGEFSTPVPLGHEINGEQCLWVQAGVAAPISLPLLSGQAPERGDSRHPSWCCCSGLSCGDKLQWICLGERLSCLVFRRRWKTAPELKYCINLDNNEVGN